MTLTRPTQEQPAALPEELKRRVRAQAGRARRHLLRRRNALARAWHGQSDLVHLVPDPVFILCPVRSGSTLLRSMLDMHTQICSPQELHLATMKVGTDRGYAEDSWSALGLSLLDLENVLWDRALHLLLAQSGKRIIVDKTPQNAASWERIHEFWPQARYLHLRRHPGSVLESMALATPSKSAEWNIDAVLNYGHWLDAARLALPGPTIRYEDLTSNTEPVLREVCRYLGVRYEPRMQQYKPRRTRAGFGDWSANIRSGRVQPHRRLPAVDEAPAQLHPLIRSWGY
jgi:Sulfotransferase family